MKPRILIIGFTITAMPRDAAVSYDEVAASIFPIRCHTDLFLDAPPRKACFLNSGPVRKRGKGKVHRY